MSDVISLIWMHTLYARDADARTLYARDADANRYMRAMRTLYARDTRSGRLEARIWLA